MTTALVKIADNKPAKRAKPAKKSAKSAKSAKKPAAKKSAKAAKPAPTDAMLDRVIDLVDDANDAICDLDDASVADTVDEYYAAVAEASKKLARVMRGMAALASKLDPAAYAAAQEKARQLPVVAAPKMMH
mgnify:FL=1